MKVLIPFSLPPDVSHLCYRSRSEQSFSHKLALYQGCNARKVISDVYLLYCSVLSPGVNVNTRRMSKPHMESIFYIKNQLNILFIGNFYVNYQNDQNLMLLTTSDTAASIPPRDNWFQNVRRVYASAINLPCIITLLCIILNYRVI